MKYTGDKVRRRQSEIDTHTQTQKKQVTGRKQQEKESKMRFKYMRLHTTTCLTTTHNRATQNNVLIEVNAVLMLFYARTHIYKSVVDNG